jgi:conjugative transposon TraM protein
MRTKFTIIGIIGVVVIGLLYLIYLTLPRDEKSKGDEVMLRSDIKSGYTVDEMIKEVKKNTRRNQYEETKPDTSNEEDLQRIQELIKQNEGAFQEPSVQPQRAVTVAKPEIKDKELLQIDTTSIAKTKPAQPARRTFNSIRLIKEDETNAIKAFVHSTQTVMVGSTLKMQLAENCLTDDGQRIRKGTPVYGEVTAIDGERVIVKISSININNNILPFKRNVYSRDAIEGIYVPGNPKSDVAKDAGAAAASGANTNISGGFDIGTQLVAGAANSVISATKSATSKNIRKIKVTIKTNYQILLMEDKKP